MPPFKSYRERSPTEKERGPSYGRGKQNSSRTRVVPVVSTLLERDPSRRSWLPALLALPGTVVPGDIGEILAAVPRRIGGKEKALPPPGGLLRWL